MPEHRERLHRLPRDGAADAVLRDDLLGRGKGLPRRRSGRRRSRPRGASRAARSGAVARAGPRCASRGRQRTPTRSSRAETGEMALEQRPGRPPSAPAGGRSARARGRRAGRGSPWRRRCSDRSSAASRRRASAGSRGALVRELLLAACLRLVDADEQVDEVDARDDPCGAAADTVEQVHAAVAAPDRVPVAEPRSIHSESSAGPASSFTSRTFSAAAAICCTTPAPSPTPRYAGASWTITGTRDRARDADEVVDERSLAERSRSSARARRRSSRPPPRRGGRARSRRGTLGAPTPTNTGTAPADLVDDDVRQQPAARRARASAPRPRARRRRSRGSRPRARSGRPAAAPRRPPRRPR